MKKQVIVGQSNENEVIIKTGVKPDDELFLNPPEKADKLALVRLSKEELHKYEAKPANQKKTAGNAKDLTNAKHPIPKENTKPLEKKDQKGNSTGSAKITHSK